MLVSDQSSDITLKLDLLVDEKSSDFIFKIAILPSYIPFPP